MGAVKISKGIYEYKGYRISNCGYYEPDHCIWWEAVDMKTGCAAWIYAGGAHHTGYSQNLTV